MWKVYLAGPITGKSFSEAFAWREYVAEKLKVNPEIQIFNPLSGKEFLAKEAKLKDYYPEHPLTQTKVIFFWDRYRVLLSDIVLFNFLSATEVSIGSCFELAWAFEYGKIILVVMEENNIHNHTFVREAATFILPSLDLAIETILQLTKS